MEAITKKFSDYILSNREERFPLVIQEWSDVPLKSLFNGDEIRALENYFLRVEKRFPFGQLPFGWKRGSSRMGRVKSKDNVESQGFPYLTPLLKKDRIAVLHHNSFLLLINYDRPSGEVFLLKSGFFDDASTISLAVQATVGLFAPLYGGMMLHACSAEINGGGYIFFGGSGAGKSTIADLIGKDRLLADDGSLLFRRGRCYYTMPSPFTQVSSRKNCGETVSAKRFFFLIKDEDDYLEEIKPGEAMLRILHNHIHFFRYFPEREAKETFTLVREIVERFPFHNIHFTRSINPLTFFRERT